MKSRRSRRSFADGKDFQIYRFGLLEKATPNLL